MCVECNRLGFFEIHLCYIYTSKDNDWSVLLLLKKGLRLIITSSNIYSSQTIVKWNTPPKISIAIRDFTASREFHVRHNCLGCPWDLLHVFINKWSNSVLDDPPIESLKYYSLLVKVKKIRYFFNILFFYTTQNESQFL